MDVPENPLVGFQVVHGFRVEGRPGESIAVVFSPVAKVGKVATVKGPFEVVLKRSGSEDIRLHSYILPIPGDKDLAPGERQLAEDPNAAKGSNPQVQATNNLNKHSYHQFQQASPFKASSNSFTRCLFTASGLC